MGLSSFTFTQRATEKKQSGKVWVMVVQGHSRLLKLLPIKSPYAISYYYIVSTVYAYLLSFPRYSVICWSKICVIAVSTNSRLV